MRAVKTTLIVGFAVCLLLIPAFADNVSKDEIKGLDEQVQDIKSEVLSIAAELGRLEEKLLYPSGSQVALFVSLARNDSFRLDALEIRLDGRPVASHLYSFKELEALARGGMQRIYTGNVSTGPRELEVTVLGKSASGGDHSFTRTATINKGIGPKLVEIRLAGPDGPSPGIEISAR